ncbi:Nucleotidylyl transferase superfamily protein [Prunus dulcis]|uniref:Tryptophanyl-tRNA synthetase n=1 Tax=Prunus dulcis TaxID=3755 RepID=A0A4Y1RR18_PRUDU|nr:Nucleotidylyl transferase superfamily protein [Prunus dulcis]
MLSFYKNMVKVGKCVTYNKVVGIFGFTCEDYIGKVFHLCSGQDNIRCLIPCTIDQGETGKMSASDPNSAIYINRYAFSGGQDSIERPRAWSKSRDLPFKYLSFFMDDDAKLEAIRKARLEYSAGRVLTGEVKQLLIQVLTELVERHRRARAAVTDEGSFWG